MIAKHWTDRLSEYVDGELDAAEVAALEMHVASCGECRTTLEELRQVVTAAVALPDREPERDLFPTILERIREGDAATVVPLRPARPTRRFTFTLPQLAAAAVAVMTLSAGAAWFAVRPAPERTEVSSTMPSAATPAAEPTGVQSESDVAASFVADVRQGNDAAIGQLEALLEEQRGELDPETIAVIEQSLAIIDEAIAEARTALENDPSNPYLYRHLDNTLNKKVELLRRATRRAAT
jgi:anti-sigma factor RsiW